MSAPRKIWVPVPVTDEGPCYVDKDEAEMQWGCASTAYHHEDAVRELAEALEKLADEAFRFMDCGDRSLIDQALVALAKIAQDA